MLIEQGLQTTRAASAAPCPSAACAAMPRDSALACLEPRVALADHKHLAATAHDLAVAMPQLGGLERGKHLHGQLLWNQIIKARKCIDWTAGEASKAGYGACRRRFDVSPAAEDPRPVADSHGLTGVAAKTLRSADPGQPESSRKGRNKPVLDLFRRAESGALPALLLLRGKPGRASMHGCSGRVPLTRICLRCRRRLHACCASGPSMHRRNRDSIRTSLVNTGSGTR